MTSPRPSGAPSAATDDSAQAELIALLRVQGGPLLEALEAHAPGARDAAEGAAAYAFAVAVDLGMDRWGAELAREATKLHQVGRLYIPAEVLAKPPQERTGEEEAQLSDSHSAGAQLARGAGLPERVCEWIRLGAERWDGGGPDGLGGEEIPLHSRISRGAHACYAALAESRSGEGGPPPAERLSEAAGHELDPAVAAALRTVLARAGGA